MASRKGISAARRKAIYKRKTAPRWDQRYLPSILVTPQGAPSVSRAFIFTPEKLEESEFHLLSTPERSSVLLDPYHPAVVGLQAPRMLPLEPTSYTFWTSQKMGMTSAYYPTFIAIEELYHLLIAAPSETDLALRSRKSKQRR